MQSRLMRENIYKAWAVRWPASIGKETPDRGEQKRAKVGCAKPDVAGSQTTSRQGPYVAGAQERWGENGAVGRPVSTIGWKDAGEEALVSK